MKDLLEKLKYKFKLFKDWIKCSTESMELYVILLLIVFIAAVSLTV